MTKKKTTDVAEKSLYKYADLINFDVVNKSFELSKDNIPAISKKTMQNIAHWALNGADESEIASNLELTEKQFRTFCELCPVTIYIMSQAREMANIIVAGSILQTAIGGQRVGKEQLVKISEFNDDGIKIGEHYEKMWVEEELPPNPNLLKFLAEHKLSEKFGDKSTDDDGKKFKKVLDSMSAEELKNIEKAMLNEN